jgi:mono/diheme cytochrome c family protein
MARGSQVAWAKVQGDTVNGKLLGGLAVCGVLLVGSFAVAQSPRKEKAKETPLINSIQGPALFKAYCASCHGADPKGDGPMHGQVAQSEAVRLDPHRSAQRRNVFR